jgi:putative tricarboxylic transport membrane protein
MQPTANTRRPGEIAFGVALLMFSLFMLWQAYEISGFSSLSSAGAFPMAMAAIMVVTATISLMHSLRLSSPRGGMRLFVKQILPPTVVVFSLLILGYSLLLEPLGFVLASFVFLLVSSWFLQAGQFKRALLLSVISIVRVYIVFRLMFQVVLPEGVIPERSIMAAIGTLVSGGK